MRRTIGNYQKSFLRLVEEYYKLRKENIQNKLELSYANDALIEARATLEKFGWPDCPFLDDGIAAVASECKRLEDALKERLENNKGMIFAPESPVLHRVIKENEWLEKTLERPKKPNWLTGIPEDPKGEK